MRTVTYVEIDVDACSLVYGEYPCEAYLGVTGDRKCFNTLVTCQDTQNYNPVPKTLRFAVSADYLPTTPQAIPCIDSINISPTRLRIGEDMGQRASVTVTFADFASSDFAFSVDPYKDSRGEAKGTFWGKFHARNRYLRGRPLRVIYGELGQELADMETRHYVIEEAFLSAESYTIIAKDPLKLADDDRAQVPRLSKGRLASAINASNTNATITPAEIAEEYSAAGVMRVGPELMDFTRSGASLTLTRGQYGTEAVEHEEDVMLQEAQVYSAMKASEIVADLLTQAGVTSFDLSEWEAADELVIRRVYSALIAEPAPIRKLIAELSEQAGFTIWWDEIDGNVKFKPLGALASDAEVTSDVMISGSYRSKEESQKRVSQAWVYFGIINPIESADEPKNYRFASVRLDLDAESSRQYGQPAIRKIFSRWIEDRAAANEIGDRLLQRFRDPPRVFRFALMNDAARKINIGTGDPFIISHFSMQDDEGNVEFAPAAVTAFRPAWGKAEIEAEEIRITVVDPDAPFYFELTENVSDPAVQGQKGFNLRERFDKTFAATPDADTVIEVLVPASVVIGSTTTSVPSFDVGDWPAGADITIRVQGVIAGAGGRGGMGLPSLGSVNGQPGGVALYTRFPVTVINNGTIGGGGGGGASSAALATGGGGGAGRSPGLPGIRGNTQTGTGSLTEGGAGASGAGAGGDLGDPGEDVGVRTGGAAGAAIDGDSFVTLSGSGTVLGSQVN